MRVAGGDRHAGVDAVHRSAAEWTWRRTDACGAEVLLGEKVVGRIGSSCVSPRFGPIALALVRREAAPGDTVLVSGAEAEVVELPF